MKYEFIITEQAEQDILQAVLYYENQQVNLGKKFLSQLENYFKTIKKSPELFQIKHKHFREVFIKKFPYVIIYEIFKNKIVVYAVFNTYQDPDKKL